jgi:hypothetical protein
VNKVTGNLFCSSDNGKTWAMNISRFPDIHRIQKSETKLWIVGKGGMIMTRKK